MTDKLLDSRHTSPGFFANMMFNSDKLRWDADGLDWPNREHSRFVDAAGIRWHVQQMGHGPQILLIHGTGSSTHSWRDFAPLLATEFTVIAPDLPGHGFTEASSDQVLSLPGMAAALKALIRKMGLCPTIVAGHSAGAAILARMVIDKKIFPSWLVSLNGALLPLSGVSGIVFSPLAKILSQTPFSAHFFSKNAEERRNVERLLKGTGSKLDDRGVELYSRLFSNPVHVAATLNMMANWELNALVDELPALDAMLAQIVGENDKTIPPEDASRVSQIACNCRTFKLKQLGHLAHEEDPESVAHIISKLVRKA